MSLRNMLWAFNQSDLTPTRKIVLLELAERAGRDAACCPSIETVAQRCGLVARTVQTTIRDLESGGFLTIDRRPGRSTVFRLNVARQ